MNNHIITHITLLYCYRHQSVHTLLNQNSTSQRPWSYDLMALYKYVYYYYYYYCYFGVGDKPSGCISIDVAVLLLAACWRASFDILLSIVTVLAVECRTLLNIALQYLISSTVSAAVLITRQPLLRLAHVLVLCSGVHICTAWHIYSACRVQCVHCSAW